MLQAGVLMPSLLMGELTVLNPGPMSRCLPQAELHQPGQPISAEQNNYRNCVLNGISSCSSG